MVMIFLGFSAGLPFLLVFSTLSAWLRDVGIARTTIGFFSWVGITYSIKVLWAPVVDRLPLFMLTRWLGKRRSWMLAAQVTIAIGLTGMALNDPHNNLNLIALFALLVAFGSATQDITIDAYRIEAVDKLLQGRNQDSTRPKMLILKELFVRRERGTVPIIIGPYAVRH